MFLKHVSILSCEGLASISYHNANAIRVIISSSSGHGLERGRHTGVWWIQVSSVQCTMSSAQYPVHRCGRHKCPVHSVQYTGVAGTSVQCKCKVPSWHRTFLAVKVAPLAQKVAARVAKGTNIGEGRWQSLTMVYCIVPVCMV